MTITADWADNSKTCLIITIPSIRSVEVAESFLAVSWNMMDEVAHPIDVIYHFPPNATIASSVIPFVREHIRSPHPNSRYAYIVTENPSIVALMDMFKQNSPKPMKRFRMTTNLQDAFDQIEQEATLV